MSTNIYFTTLDGDSLSFDPDQAELLLPLTRSRPDVLYRLATSCPSTRFVSGSFGEGDREEYKAISERMAARAYAVRGEVPPDDLAHHLVLDEFPRPWLMQGSRKWVGVAECSIGETLYQTIDFRFVVEHRDRTYRQDRLEAMTPFMALDWLSHNDLDAESDEVREEIQAREAEPRSATPIRTSLRVQHSTLNKITKLSKRPAATTSRGEQKRGDLEARAVTCLMSHTEWTNKKIAEELSCHSKSLSRLKLFNDARALLRSTRQEAPRGWKDDKTGKVEAYDKG